MWLLIGWQRCWQPIRSYIWTKWPPFSMHFQCIFVNEKSGILMNIFCGSVHNKSFVEAVAWLPAVDKPLAEPMMIKFYDTILGHMDLMSQGLIRVTELKIFVWCLQFHVRDGQSLRSQSNEWFNQCQGVKHVQHLITDTLHLPGRGPSDPVCRPTREIYHIKTLVNQQVGRNKIFNLINPY